MVKKNKLPPFVAIYKALLKNPEWRNLPSSAKVLYVYMRGKFNAETLSEVSLAYSEVDDMFSTSTISKAFKELQDKGFIEKTKYGGLYGGVCRYKFIGEFKDYHYKGYKV
jgi:hypothetical protein